MPSPLKMKEINKIAQKVLLLLMDILVFTWQIVRKVILPNRSRKGNLLSSLLTFFVGLLERIVSFEKNILQRPVVFTHKYVKQGLIVAVGFLFLLSSFEWTIAPSAEVAGHGSPAVVASAHLVASDRTVAPARVNFSALVPARAVALAWSFVPAPSAARTVALVIPRRWLRFRVFRI